ncbi:MAG: FtsX-like permease family protein [Luteitalea sp.]|nr:FtsX-like permease family protein [Luteitalea sp.]
MVNLKLAFRALFRYPFVTTVAIVSLALGIGANAAIFSLFDRLLLRPLPVAEPDRLVNLAAPGPKTGYKSCGDAGGCDNVFSYPMFRDLQRAQTGFTGIAAHYAIGANLAYRGRTSSGGALLVSGSYFPVLGLQPALGRLLGSGDDRVVGEPRVVVLSHAYWQSRLGQNPNVLNGTLIVNGHTMTIVGVAPRGFDGTTLGSRADVFVPITTRWLMQAGGSRDPENRNDYWLYLFARLRSGVSIEQARTGINVPYRTLVSDVEAPLQSGMSDQMLARFKVKEVDLSPGSRGQSDWPRTARAPLVLLLGVSGLVLLIACANIANLLLARTVARADEMAVRLSIGASRRHLIMQLLAESCLLAAFGGLAGLLVAPWTLHLIQALLPAGEAATVPVQLDARTLLFAAALTLGTGLLFGLFPALHSTRIDLLSTLKGQAGQPSGSRGAARFRTSLVTAQIALSMTLLVLAGLFTKSLFNVSRVDLGQDIDQLATFGISPELNGYSPERSRILFERLEEELAALPGVTGVTASTVQLLSYSNSGSNVSVEGFQASPDVDTDSSMRNKIGPAFFRTLRIPLIAGREFTRADAHDTSKVAIVNQAFARNFNLGTEAVGTRMATGAGYPLDIEIVGLVQDAKYSEVKGEVPPQFFLPYRQDEELGAITFYLRTAVDPEQLLSAIPRTVAQLDPHLPVESARTMTDQVRNNVYVDWFISVLSAAFAVLATMLAAIGLYGVLAYTVAQRTRELGLRMALGAAPSRVRGMVLRQVGLMIVVGGLIGLASSVALGRAAEALLFELEGRDPIVLMVATVALTIVALGAGLVPAHRASRIDPMQALRY